MRMAATCTICGGSPAEHFNSKNEPITQHAYTDKPGDLSTHKQAESRVLKPSTPAGEGDARFFRLVAVLKAKNILNEAEVMHIATGLSAEQVRVAMQIVKANNE